MGTLGRTPGVLLHEFVNGLAQVVDGTLVTGLHRVHHAVAHMVFQDHLAGTLQSGADGCQLDQHFGAVVSVFHHPLYLFQMTDGPGKPVDDSFLIFVDMAVGIGIAIFMDVAMGIRHSVYLLSVA